MSNNTVSILIQAKDQASSVIKSMTGQVKDGISNMVDKVQSSLKTTSVALAGVGVGLTAYEKSATDYTASVVSSAKALSRATGETIAQSSQLNYVIEHMGLSTDATSTMFNALTKQIEAQRQQSATATLQQQQLNNKIADAQAQIKELTSEQTRNGDSSGRLQIKIAGLALSVKDYQQQLAATSGPLDQLNVQTNNVDGSTRSFNDILLDIADRFHGMPDGLDKTNLALQLFGRSGADMIKTLDLGRQGITDLEQEADKLGLTLTDKTVASINSYVQAQKRSQDANNALRITVGTLTAPVMANFDNMIARVTTSLVGADSPFRNVIADVLAFGGPVAGAAAALVNFIANMSGIGGPLGFVLTSLLGVGTAILGAGGVIFAFSKLFGLNIGPAQAALSGFFDQIGSAARGALGRIKDVGDSPAWDTLKSKVKDALGDVVTGLNDLTKDMKSGGFSAAIQDIEKRLESIDFHKVLDKVLKSITSYPWGRHTAEITYGIVTIFGTLAAGTEALVALLTPSLIKIANGIISGLIAGIIEATVKHPLDMLNLVLMLGFLPEKVIGAIGGALTKIPIVGTFADWILKGLAKIGDLITAPLKKVFKEIGTTAIDSLKEGWDATSQTFKDAIGISWDWVKTKAKEVVDDIVGFFKDIPSRIGSAVTDIGKSVGSGIKDTLHSWHIPGFATGTTFAPGGLAVVGEQGPELVNLPRGSQVTPAPQTQQLLGHSGVSIANLNVYNNVDARLVAREIGWQLAR